MADAELEASEVLHSLLSVERVENKSLPSSTATEIDESNILWHTPVHGIQTSYVHGDKIILQSADLPSSCNQDQVRCSYKNWNKGSNTMTLHCRFELCYFGFVTCLGSLISRTNLRDDDQSQRFGN